MSFGDGSRENRSLADLGWQIHHETAAWDGLTVLLPQLWQRAGRPVRVADWVAEYQRCAQSQH